MFLSLLPNFLFVFFVFNQRNKAYFGSTAVTFGKSCAVCSPRTHARVLLLSKAILFSFWAGALRPLSNAHGITGDSSFSIAKATRQRITRNSLGMHTKEREMKYA